MASIVQKKNRYYVVYLYDSEDGRRKQKWESFKTKEEAKRRKAEIEYRQELGSLVIPKCKTVEEQYRSDQKLHQSHYRPDEAFRSDAESPGKILYVSSADKGGHPVHG